MSKIPFANLSEDKLGGETSGEWKQTNFTSEGQASVDVSDDSLSENGDVGIGQNTCASYQKGGKGQQSKGDSKFDDDFANINSTRASKNKSYMWLRHPKVRDNWKTVAGAIFLLTIGIVFLICGIVLAAIPDHNGPTSVIFFVCAAVCLLPGGYHTIYIYRATKGWRGYNFESLPSFQ